MKIVISWSVDFAHEIKKLSDDLKVLGFDVIIPPTSERILRGEITAKEIKKEKENSDFSERTIKNDAIRNYCEFIKNSDALLIANFGKHNIKNYIGGGAFLEMGFAHIFHKKIFLLNGIPDMMYIDEIKAMQPVELNGDLSKIK